MLNSTKTKSIVVAVVTVLWVAQMVFTVGVVWGMKNKLDDTQAQAVQNQNNIQTIVNFINEQIDRNNEENN